ncbi:U7 snRNA-associated Sm-like protein LSm11 [Anopheles nili]|uniref:U7 snRNA-associated Sm-like protein LSm11 n=1 Tax=Anopheles nili TaxID=185578 RepID=UPI00237A5897|nr:U7 snRNA-associated Sm-like protein LSm11 [Anopheles nili]
MSDNSDDESNSSRSDKECNKDSDSSSELDVGNSRFDPLKALYSAKFKVPVARAKLHDNVQTLEAKQNLLGGFAQPFDEERVKAIRAASSSKKNIPPPELIPQRRFLPEQGLVYRERSIRHKKNIFLRLEKGWEGPLSLMKQWMDERTRVRIDIRKQKGVRGYLTGVIEIFDRHWNIAVSDVHETWSRRKYRYSTNTLHPESIIAPQDCSDRLRNLGIVLPKTKVACDGSKNVIITRNVPQLFVKGTHVVLVRPELPVPKVVETKEKQ